METATSNVRRIICVKIRIDKFGFEAAAVWLPNRVRRRWPAIILAERRIAKVPGRIVFLIVSIITINDISADGVPWGTK